MIAKITPPVRKRYAVDDRRDGADQAYLGGNLFQGCTLGPACNQNVECAL